MAELVSPLEKLQTRYDALTTGRGIAGDSTMVHTAILDRLASNRDGAERAGWTGCTLERDGGLGRLRLFGTPPGGQPHTEVPDPS